MITFGGTSPSTNNAGSDQMLICCAVIWLHLTIDVIRGRWGCWGCSIMFTVWVTTLIKVGLVINRFWVCTLTANKMKTCYMVIHLNCLKVCCEYLCVCACVNLCVHLPTDGPMHYDSHKNWAYCKEVLNLSLDHKTGQKHSICQLILTVKKLLLLPTATTHFNM